MKERYFIVFWSMSNYLKNWDRSITLKDYIKNIEDSIRIHAKDCESKSIEIIREYNFPSMIILKSTDENISESEMSYLFSNIFVKHHKFIGDVALFVKEISSSYPILCLNESLNNHV